MQNENQPGISKHTRRHENLYGEQQDIQIKPNSKLKSFTGPEWNEHTAISPIKKHNTKNEHV